MKVSSALICLAMVICLGSCGGDDSGDQGSSAVKSTVPDTQTAPSSGASGPAEAVQALYSAMSKGDGQAACEATTASLQRAFVTAERGAHAEWKHLSCGEMRTKLIEEYPPRLRRAFAHLKIKKVTVRGNRAKVIHQIPGSGPPPVDTSVPVVREDATWKVAG
jgi:hypothetical protein